MSTTATPTKAPPTKIGKPAGQWSPFGTFDDVMQEMQRRFSEMVSPIPFPASRDRAKPWRPFVDLVEEGDEMVLRADLPGIKKENIDIFLEKGDLIVRGEQKDEKEIKEENCYRMERRRGSFYRRLALPQDVTADSLDAAFRDGVLEIRFPKPVAEETAPAKVEIH